MESCTCIPLANSSQIGRDKAKREKQVKKGFFPTIGKSEESKNIPLGFEILHDVQKVIVDIGLVKKLDLDLIQVRQGVFDVEWPVNACRCGSGGHTLRNHGRHGSTTMSLDLCLSVMLVLLRLLLLLLLQLMLTLSRYGQGRQRLRQSLVRTFRWTSLELRRYLRFVSNLIKAL